MPERRQAPGTPLMRGAGRYLVYAVRARGARLPPTARRGGAARHGAAVVLRARLRLGVLAASARRAAAVGGGAALVQGRAAPGTAARAVVRLVRPRQLAAARPRPADRRRQPGPAAELPGRPGRGMV